MLEFSASCLESKRGKIIWKKNLEIICMTLSLLSLIQVPQLPSFQIRLLFHFLMEMLSLLALLSPSHTVSKFTTPSGSISIWLDLFFPHVAQNISDGPSSSFHIIHLPLFSKLRQNPNFCYNLNFFSFPISTCFSLIHGCFSPFGLHMKTLGFSHKGYLPSFKATSDNKQQH